MGMPQWRASDVVFVALAIALGAALIMAAGRLHFSIGLNDFFGLSFAGEHWSWADPRTWRNGFYPALSIYYVHLLGEQAPRLALLFNAVDAVWLAGSVYVVGRSRGRGFSGLSAALLLMALPSVVTITLTQTADLAAMAGVAVALAAADAHTRASTHGQTPGLNAVILAGVAAFLAVQMRLHTLTLLLPAAVAGAALLRTHRLPWLAVAGGTVAGGALQACVNVAAGYPPFHTSQAFNLYRTLHPINWLQTSQLADLPGAGAIIAGDPAGVAAAWLAGLWTLAAPLLVAASALLLATVPRVSASRSATDRRTTIALAVGMLCYGAAVALGGSERGILVLWAPAVMVGLMSLPDRSKDSTEGARIPLLLLGTAAVIGGLLTLPAAKEHVEGRLQTWQLSNQIEDILVQELGVRSSTEVFSEEFDFYLPDTPPWWTHHLGGWSRVDLHGFDEASPELCVATLDCLYESAGVAGVRVLVLGPRAGLAGVALGQLREQPTASPALFAPIGAIAGMIIYVRQTAVAPPNETTP